MVDQFPDQSPLIRKDLPPAFNAFPSDKKKQPEGGRFRQSLDKEKSDPLSNKEKKDPQSIFELSKDRSQNFPNKTTSDTKKSRSLSSDPSSDLSKIEKGKTTFPTKPKDTNEQQNPTLKPELVKTTPEKDTSPLKETPEKPQRAIEKPAEKGSIPTREAPEKYAKTPEKPSEKISTPIEKPSEKGSIPTKETPEHISKAPSEKPSEKVANQTKLSNEKGSLSTEESLENSSENLLDSVKKTSKQESVLTKTEKGDKAPPSEETLKAQSNFVKVPSEQKTDVVEKASKPFPGPLQDMSEPKETLPLAKGPFKEPERSVNTFVEELTKKDKNVSSLSMDSSKDLSSSNPLNVQGVPFETFSAASTQSTPEISSPSPVRQLATRVIEQIQVMKREDLTLTRVTLQHPPILAGATLTLESSSHAKEEFNVSFANLSNEGQLFLDQKLKEGSLTEVLKESGYTIHIVTTTTENIPLFQEKNDQPPSDRDQQQQPKKQQKDQFQESEEE